MGDYAYKTPPFAHQRAEFEATRERAYHGLLWEMGTGKSKVVIDTAAWMYEQGAIDGLVVLAPNSVHFNWHTDELPTHLPDQVAARTRSFVYQSPRAGTQWHQRAVADLLGHDGLAVMLMSYNAVMTERGRRALWAMLKQRRCLYVLDESTYIKTPIAKRTKRVVASGKYAPFRRILTGTPVANSPFDIYSQMRFLDENFWRRHSIGTSQVFRHTFADFQQFLDGNGRTQEFPVRYKNLDQLREWLAPCTSRVLKEDVLDLPPKLYTRRYFDLTAEQRRAYDDLKSDYETELAQGQLVTTPLVIQRVTRFQQITSGYLPTDDGPLHRFTPNPRLGVAEDFRDECGCPALVWAQRDEDVDALMHLLGDRAVRHDGKCTDAEKERAKAAFKAGEVQFFVAKPSVGGEGLTLTQARAVFYYNNGYNLSQRQQSEDRAHRIGQAHPVTYVDAVARGTIDEGILRALLRKFNVGAEVTGDQAREWL